MKPFKIVYTAIISLLFLNATAQNPQLKKLWETDSTLKVPESVLYYAPEKILFVSNINGKSNEKDLNGFISKISPDGKIVKESWAKNLSAPKGMGIYQQQLYVADLAEVVIIDLKSGNIADRIPIEGAIFLNDITIDPSGVVYVSDSRTGKVHEIKNKKASLYMENKKGVNGLLAVDDNLYMLVKDTLYRSDKNKVLTQIITGLDESSDGVVQVDNENFIVSCWNGILYHVNQKGTMKVLLDMRKEEINTADLGFDADKKILYVPTFYKNKVIAYQFTN